MKIEEQISKQADEYAKQFDSDHEAIAEHYYQGALRVISTNVLPHVKWVPKDEVPARGQAVWVYGRVNIGSEHECFCQFACKHNEEGFCDFDNDLLHVDVTHILL